MLHYFYVKGDAGLAGTNFEAVFSLEFENDELSEEDLIEAHTYGGEWATERIESYVDVVEWKEENGVEYEYEYDYYVEAIDPETYSNYIDEGVEEI